MLGGCVINSVRWGNRALFMLKRKLNVLTIESKMEILNRLDKGDNGASVTKSYNIGTLKKNKIKTPL